MAKTYKRKLKLPMDYGSEKAPQALDIEEVVLGSIMLEGNMIDTVMADFNPGIFFKESNILIAQAICELYVDSEKIDIITITQQLRKKGKLDVVGGAYYISTLTNRVAGTANLEYHIRLLQQTALKRKIIELCSLGVRQAFDETEDVFDVYHNLMNDLDNALKQMMHYETKDVGTIHRELIKEGREIALKGSKSGVPSGLLNVDNLTNGWQKTDMIIIAGRPGMGKTASVVSIVMHPAIIKQIPIGIFSLEMSSKQLVSRMQSFLSEVENSKIIKKQYSVSELDIIEGKSNDLNTAPIFIDDTPNISLLELKAKARRLVKENNVELLIIDYLQLMRSGMIGLGREQEIAEISRGIKGLAKELDIPIIALSQLSRGVESRTDKKPMLSDLRESGQIEQDADMVIFCYRPEYYDIQEYEIGGEVFNTEGLFMWLVAKHRNGELGEIPLSFIKEQVKVTNYNPNSFSNPINNDEFKITPNVNF
jgi:replicative DNA helicase